MILEVLIYVLLLAVFYQDLKYRAVYWWMFPLLTITLGAKAWQETDLTTTVQHWIINAAFLIVQMVFLSLYFIVKERKWVNIFDGYLGLGDLLFLLGTAIYFSFFNYIFYYVISLFIVILGTLLNNLFKTSPNPKIPLAGYQSVLFIALLVVDKFSDLNLLSDQWIINFYN